MINETSGSRVNPCVRRQSRIRELETHAKAVQKFTVSVEPVALGSDIDPASDSDTEGHSRTLARRYDGRRRHSRG
jgi:hypothetical protein